MAAEHEAPVSVAKPTQRLKFNAAFLPVPGAGAEADVPDGKDIFYVCGKTLGSLEEKLKACQEVARDLVNELTLPEKLADDEIMVPVDMRGAGEAFDDVESMLEKLGARGTAQAFVKARGYFEANEDDEPEDLRPKPMTAAEWKTVLEDDIGEGEEDLLEADDEEPEDELHDEGEGDGAGAAGEPDSKRAKTE